MTKASVIVPAYKRIEQTIKTIDLLQQSKGSGMKFALEVIVADGTPDDTLKQALRGEFADKVLYTRPKKAGIATDKNQGAKVASCPILIFCDSDIEVKKDTILQTVKALQQHKTAGAVGGQVIWRGGPNDGKHDRPRPEDRTETVDGVTYIEAIYSRYIATYRDVFWEVGGYDEVVFNMRGEGSDLSVRYWRAGYPLVYDNSIVVHHVHETEGGIIRGTQHPEWGIAKDLLLLAYKYDMLEKDFDNFSKTVAANFAPLGKAGHYRLLQGIGKYLDFITEIKPELDRQKRQMLSPYDFKFLEIFSNKQLFQRCIAEAREKLQQVRRKTL